MTPNSYPDIRLSIGGQTPSDARPFDVSDPNDQMQGGLRQDDSMSSSRSSIQRPSARWSASELFNSEFGGRGSISFERAFHDYARENGNGNRNSLFGDFGDIHPGMSPLSKGTPSNSASGSELFRNSFFTGQRGSQRVSDFAGGGDDDLSSAAFAAANALDLTRNSARASFEPGRAGSGRWSAFNREERGTGGSLSTPSAAPGNNSQSDTQQQQQQQQQQRPQNIFDSFFGGNSQQQ
jgi:hypothetical protein